MSIELDRRSPARHASVPLTTTPGDSPTSLPDLARIPEGEFLMGSSEEADERPIHRVELAEFFIGRYQVTNDDYARFVRATDRPPPAIGRLPLVARDEHEATFLDFAAPYVWRDGVPPPGRGSHPVVLVTFDDANDYCVWLAEESGRTVRLPTEAEWEKAARGGVESHRFPWGDTTDALHANFLTEPSSKPQRGTRPGGTYPPNGFGLCDMGGNVWEWISDWYDADYYAASERRGPAGPSGGAMRIVRGGSWVNSDARSLRCACRHPVPPDTYAYSIGFRIVCEP